MTSEILDFINIERIIVPFDPSYNVWDCAGYFNKFGKAIVVEHAPGAAVVAVVVTRKLHCLARGTLKAYPPSFQFELQKRAVAERMQEGEIAQQCNVLGELPKFFDDAIS